MEITLAEALLRRKELMEKVELLKKIKDNAVFYEVRGQRVKITEGIENIDANYPKLEVNQVTKEYDFHSRQLRLIDAAIQQTNWTTKLPIDDLVMGDYGSK